MQEMKVRSLGWKDPLEEEMATHSSILSWEIPWTEDHTVKGFGIVNKTEVDIFLELFCFFSDPTDVCNLMSASSAFSKSYLNIWKSTVRVLLKPGLENFEHYFATV